MSNITCGNCHEKHDTVGDVRACYGVPVALKTIIATATVHPDPFGEATPSQPLATPKQVSYAMSLQAQRADENDHVSEADYAAMTRKEMSAAIDHLLSLPKPDKAQRTVAVSAVLEDGMYYVEDTNEVFKVYHTRTSGAQCVKRLDIVKEATATTPAVGRFTYLGAVAKHLPAKAQRMSLESAKALGRIYGFCVKCAATLTDETSIASGIGPVCGADGAWGAVSGDVTLEQPKAQPQDDNACTPGQSCHHDSLCSKHSWAYQVKYGRAANE